MNPDLAIDQNQQAQASQLQPEIQSLQENTEDIYIHKPKPDNKKEGMTLIHVRFQLL